MNAKRVSKVCPAGLPVLLALTAAAPAGAMNDPVTGRWVTRDPLLYNARRLNPIRSRGNSFPFIIRSNQSTLSQTLGSHFLVDFYLYSHLNPTKYVDPTGKAACANPASGGHNPVQPAVDIMLWLNNLFNPHHVSVWSEAGSCSLVDEERRGCIICHQRCRWECTDVRLCFEITPAGREPTGCCVTIAPAGTICNSGWIRCLIGDHILFSCEPGIHGVGWDDFVGDLDCWGVIDEWLDEIVQYFGA